MKEICLRDFSVAIDCQISTMQTAITEWLKKTLGTFSTGFRKERHETK